MFKRVLASALVVFSVAASSAEINLVAGSVAITGRLTQSAQCEDSEAMLWVSTGSTLLYQAAVMKGTTFEFHVMPGPMEVVVSSKSGCLAEERFLAQRGQVKEIQLQLSPVTTASAGANRAPASSGYWCPYCGGPGTMGILPQSPPFSPQVPWWVSQGNLAYSNFYYPAPWMGGGIYGPYYPGGGGGWWNGGAMMGKPNLYVSAPEGTKLEIDVGMKPGSNLLAAVPLHGKKGWSAEVLGPYRLKSGDSEQAFLFYDYRFNPKVLQETEGFCTTPEKLLPELTRHLEMAGFEAYEVKDFRDYWSYKMPRANSYCVFPQDERQLSKVATLKISPVPRSVTRVGFMIVPQQQGFEPPMFKSKPTKVWAPHVLQSGKILPVEKGRDTASSGSLRIREWGVGFLQGR
jgi:hypothetical protein